MNLDRKNFPLVLIWVLISIIETFAVDWQAVYATDLYGISCLIISNFIFQIGSWKMANRDFISFYFAFVLFYYLFHFGQVLITGILPDYPLEYLNYVTAYMTTSNLGETIKVCLLCINFFFIGGLLFKYKLKPADCISRKNVGAKLFWTLFPIKLILDLILIVVATYLGYMGANAAMNKIPGFLASLGNMWYATIPIYYLDLLNEHKINKANHLVVWTVLYMCITMLTGNRGHQTVAIICLMIVVIIANKNISFKHLVRYSFYGIIGLFFLDIIYSFRETSISEFFSNLTSFTESEENSNILIETIGTFGETIYTPFLVIEGLGKDFYPSFGEAFIKSIMAVIPDPTGLLKQINNEAIFTKQLGTMNAIGGSFAGEMYYNFGKLYIFFSLIIGAIFHILSDKVNKLIDLKLYASLTFSLAVCGLFMWWVRDSVGNLTRQVVWMYLLIYFFGGLKKYK